jgi:ligand-binding sensor domain-containing protein
MRRIHSTFLIPLAVLLLAQSPPEGAPEAGRDAWTHLGDYGDVRSLCRVGDSLWVGTGAGVFIYDLGSGEISDHITIGKRLPSNSVRAISKRNQDVYVGTDDGLAVFSSNEASVFTNRAPGHYSGAPLDRIHRIDFGLDHLVYLSTLGRGLGVLGADTAWVITRADSLLDDKVFGMNQQDDTTFYFATSTGLCAYRDSAWVNFRAGAAIPRAEIRQIEAAPEGGYYLVVGRRGIYWFDGESARRITQASLFPENAVAAIAVDTRGGLWACGRHGGVAVYRNGHWTKLEATSSGEDYDARQWRSAAADSMGGVYFGSADGLVLWFRDDITTSFHLPRGLPAPGVRAMTIDSTGALYALNGSYLLRFERDLSEFTLEHDSPIVVGFAVSPEGELWTVTRWEIFRRDGDRYVGLDTRLSERQPVFAAIGFDADGSLWVGTQAGNLHRFDGMIWMRMADAGDLNLGSARAFAVDGRGRLWVTGSNGRVAAYHLERWTVFGPPAFGERPAVQLAVAPNGVAVLATDAGLWGFGDGGEWKALSVRWPGGEADSTETPIWDADAPGILSLAFDPAGRLYVGTEDGVAVIDESGKRWITYEDGIGGSAVTSIFVRGTQDLWVGFRFDGLSRLPLDASGPERD